jgi:hypothetical protein
MRRLAVARAATIILPIIPASSGRSVGTNTPDAVTATMCPICAESDPSLVTTVEPSA